MSAPAPANRRSTSGSRRFNPLKVLQPKRRLQQILASSPVPAPKPASGSGVSGTAGPAATAPIAIPVPAPPAFDYCRFIELDYVPMETGCMVSMRPTKGYASTKSPSKGYTSTKSPDRLSRTTNSPSTPRSRRTPAAPSKREPYGNASISSSNSGSCKGSDCSPTKGLQKYTSCTNNHGIRPPPPEQYLTPLQQKEVCIRHLRAKLKETINTLQHRDSEIDELRGQLYRMQEDWVEEECHRVEAQLALKEARQEIQQLKQAVDTVRTRLSDAGAVNGDEGVQKYFHDINTQNHKLENLLLNMELAQVGLAKEGDGRRSHAGGSAPASVSGESPCGVPKPTVGGRGSCSCDGSPARSMTRSSTYTKLSDQAQADRNGNGPDFPGLSGEGTQDSGFVCCGENVPSRADLLLEAAFLSEETASLLNSYTKTFAHTLPHSIPHTMPHTYSQTLPRSFPHHTPHSVPHTMPHSSTYDQLCTSERMAPFHCGLGGMGCMSHPCLSHHHLYLHPLREAGIQTESCPIPATSQCPSDLDTIAEQRTFRSQACSPTSTWMSDEGEEDLDSITTTSMTTATVMSAATEPIPVSNKTLVSPLPRSATVAFSTDNPWSDGNDGSEGNDRSEEEEKQEKEKREKEDFATEEHVETSVIIKGEAEQENNVEGLDEEVEGGGENTQTSIFYDSAEKSSEIQGEVMFGSCCGDKTNRETHFEKLRVKDSPQEVDPSTSPTQTETAGLNPNCAAISPGEQPQTSQPRRSTSHEDGMTLVEGHSEDDSGGTDNKDPAGGASGNDEDSGKIEKSYWSRHFLVDLLAVAIPVVPTVAWLCRGPVRNGQPMYHIGSLLRGCCTVALHSLRRGGGLRHYPAGGGDLGGSQM